jgi:two-component system, cell cycle sensor histidine kinase and response regulator CckA
MKIRTIASPAAVLGLFILNFLFLAWVLLARNLEIGSLLFTGVIVQAMLGMLLYNRSAARIREYDHSLDHSERYIQDVAELSMDVQSIIEAKTQKYLYMNPAVTKVLGYKPEEFVEGGLEFFYNHLHPEDLPHVKRDMERMLDHGFGSPGPNREEFIQEEIYRVKTKWDEYRWFRSRRMVFTRNLDDSPKDILSVARDITEQRGFEIALVQAQEFESLGNLARRLAHDLNNILMGIQGYSELGVENREDTRRMEESLLKIRESVGRATDICRQMLAFAGRGRVQITRFQLNESLREGLPLVENLLPENIQLVLDLESDLPKVSADPNQVRYALLNLVVNAMETIGAREGDITIRTYLRQFTGEGDPEHRGLLGDFVCLEVRDSGPGMSEETLNGISDPFFRIKHPGRGLGLLTVKGIASEHHGLLQTESEPGKGTICRFYMPAATRDALVDEKPEAPPITVEAGVVLVVDDEPTIRAILSQGLGNAGYKVIEAIDGVDGFGAFVRHRSSISVVLLDLTMPRMNGDEVFEEIHKLAPEIPVILMSGYSQSEATAALAGKGLAAFLSKPCSIKETLAVVRKAMGQTAPGAPVMP